LKLFGIVASRFSLEMLHPESPPSVSGPQLCGMGAHANQH
jgi:hypothetical protein